MTTLALLYDVHGNLPALEAVLGDARSQDAGAFLLGGDYALFGPWPAETLATLHALDGATWIRGNVDRWTALVDVPDDEDLRRAIGDCRAAIGDDVAAALGTLQEQAVLDGTRYCHASPLSDMQSFMPDPAGGEERLLAGAMERRIVFGHTHLQFRRVRVDGIELINPGSVGLPLDADHRAAYALVRDDGSVEHRRVGYDHEASARAVRDQFGDADWAARTEQRLLAARA